MLTIFTRSVENELILHHVIWIRINARHARSRLRSSHGDEAIALAGASATEPPFQYAIEMLFRLAGHISTSVVVAGTVLVESAADPDAIRDWWARSKEGSSC
jgi:hypothetical protein